MYYIFIYCWCSLNEFTTRVLFKNISKSFPSFVHGGSFEKLRRNMQVRKNENAALYTASIAEKVFCAEGWLEFTNLCEQ